MHVFVVNNFVLPSVVIVLKLMTNVKNFYVKNVDSKKIFILMSFFKNINNEGAKIVY